ncbi:polysaccharide pyruvyl transferase family protein [Halomonas sp. BC04]|uniref:polysaccharide pyruvyl transferase family protein n=1 Tax=Halomonas sp. BC04 TaxID=1403540 RepID=UPI0018CBF87A|nr:polysaccharide pyruvyl transferase family protein [Halomonas sp. BC04]
MSGGTISSTLYQYSFSSPQENDKLEKKECEASGVNEDVAPAHWGEFEHLAQSVIDDEVFNDIATAICNSDVVLINGEGCIYDRTRQSRMIFFIAYLAKRFFGKPTALVNHSIVMNEPVLREIAQHVYPLLDDIVFREPDSALACPAGQSRVAADAAYLYEPEPPEQWERSTEATRERNGALWSGGAFDPHKPYACIGGGSVYFRGLRPELDAIPGLVMLCRELQGSVGQVLLTASSAKDLRILEPVSKMLDLPLAGASLPIQCAVNLVGNARVYIGARWHPSIFAHRGGVPVVALSRHTPKMDAFLKQAGIPPSHLDPFSLENQLDDVIGQVRSHLDAGEQLRVKLRADATRLSETTSENVRLLTSSFAPCA